jgi:two-component system, LuxR family, response regulator FixJ
MQHNKEPTVFIIDDDPEMRNSLCWLMESVQLNAEVFDSAIVFLKEYDVNRTGCILLDIRMPEMSGLELLDKMISIKNRLPIIVITGHGDMPMAIRAMKSGAMDFILKPFNDQQLIEQIQKSIIQNLTTLKPLSNEMTLWSYSTLTAREREIMALVIAGKLNKQIAHELKIAISTVELHRSRMMKKMQAKNIAQLVSMRATLEL